MPKLVVLTLALASFSVIFACSRDEPVPATQPAKEARATVAPGASAESTLIPREDKPEPARDQQPSEKGMGLPPDTLRPAAVDDPQAFLSTLSPGERSCLGDKDIGPQELLQMAGRSSGGSPETTATIIDCLGDDTVLRLFLATLIGQVEPFSQETSMCIREGLVPLDLRGALAPAVAGFAPANSLALGMAALNVSVVCMNEEEWAIYAPKLGMPSDFREGAACLFEEVGGSAKLAEAMQPASLGETPEELTMAFETCELEDASPLR